MERFGGGCCCGVRLTQFGFRLTCGRLQFCDFGLRLSQLLGERLLQNGRSGDSGRSQERGAAGPVDGVSLALGMALWLGSQPTSTSSRTMQLMSTP